MLTIVYAIILTMAGLDQTGNVNFRQEVAPKEMTLDECMKEAKQMNVDPKARPYVMVCAPVLDSSPPA